MGKTAKVYINYGLADKAHALHEADETDLRILSAALLLAGGEGVVSVSELESMLELSSAEVAASVKYWKGAGILSSAKREKKSTETASDTRSTEQGTVTVAQFTGVEDYSNNELVSILESRDRTGFIDEAQIALGRMFNKNEINKLLGIVDQMGFEEEAMLAILSYSARLGKKSLSYAEKIAITFHDEDVLTVAEVHARIDMLERRNDAIERIRSLYGFGGRALTTTEKKLFGTWADEYGFDFEVIKKAYEITVDATHEPAPKYANAILKKWYENGLRTVSEIDAFTEAERTGKQKAASSRTSAPKKGELSEKQAEAEEWFEQLLKQSFGE